MDSKERDSISQQTPHNQHISDNKAEVIDRTVELNVPHKYYYLPVNQLITLALRMFSVHETTHGIHYRLDT